VIAEAGADYIGLNFASGPRKIDEAVAREVLEAAGPAVEPVALFVDADEQSIVRTAEALGITIVQLSGSEPPELVESLSAKFDVIKAIKISGPESLDEMSQYNPWAFVLDTHSDEAAGGTGTSFDWSVADKLETEVKIMLAGGLTPDNVGEAMLAVRPFAVDVASGVESSPGRKDPELVGKFVSVGHKAVIARSMPLAQVAPGAITAEPVQDGKGRTVLGAGAKLTERHIGQFGKLGVTKVEAYELSDENQSAQASLSAADLEEKRQRLAKLFESAPDNELAHIVQSEAEKRLGIPREWS